MVGFGLGLEMDLWFGKSPGSRESNIREASLGKSEGVRGKGSSGTWKKSGESQAREDPTVSKDLTLEPESCWTMKACPMPALLATSHATSHPP